MCFLVVFHVATLPQSALSHWGKMFFKSHKIFYMLFVILQFKSTLNQKNRGINQLKLIFHLICLILFRCLDMIIFQYFSSMSFLGHSQISGMLRICVHKFLVVFQFQLLTHSIFFTCWFILLYRNIQQVSNATFGCCKAIALGCWLLGPACTWLKIPSRYKTCF